MFVEFHVNHSGYSPRKKEFIPTPRNVAEMFRGDSPRIKYDVCRVSGINVTYKVFFSPLPPPEKCNPRQKRVTAQNYPTTRNVFRLTVILFLSKISYALVNALPPPLSLSLSFCYLRAYNVRSTCKTVLLRHSFERFRKLKYFLSRLDERDWITTSMERETTAL
jgi:hypothetical protein